MPFAKTDNWIFRIINRMCDLAALNLCWVICSLPIITMGAATTALFDMEMKLWNKTEGYIFKGFFLSFRENFKKSTIIWLGLLFSAIVFAGDYYYWNYVNVECSIVLYVLMMALILFLSIVWICVILYAFPLTAVFDSGIIKTCMNGFFLAIRHFPTTLLLIAIPIGCTATIFLNKYASFLLFFLGISLICYINTFFYRLVFKKYISEESETED